MKRLIMLSVLLVIVLTGAFCAFEINVSQSPLWSGAGISFQIGEFKTGAEVASRGPVFRKDNPQASEEEIKGYYDVLRYEAYVQYTQCDNRSLFAYSVGPGVSYFTDDNEAMGGEEGFVITRGFLDVKADASFRVLPRLKVFAGVSLPVLMTGFQFTDGVLSDFSYLTLLGHDGLFNSLLIAYSNFRVGVSFVI